VAVGSLVSSIPRRVRQRIARELRAQRLIWLAPVAVVWVMMRQPIHLVQRADGVLVAAAIILLIASRPAGSLLIFLGVLPFHTFLFALLFRMGVPLAAVRPLAFWKELIILGLVLIKPS